MSTKNDLLERLIKISDISSPYVPVYGSNPENNKKKMEDELLQIESAIFEWTTLLHYHLAVAYRNFCSWYIRGDLRKKYLLKIIEHLEKAVQLDGSHAESKIEVARILIEEKIVRDLPKALNIIAELKLTSSLPSWMNSIEEKAKRWNGEAAIPTDCNFMDIDPTPAVLREERTKLRKIISELQKTGDPAQKIVSKRLYNLALFVAYLYDSHDCNSGVVGFMYDKAAKTAKKISNKFNFDYLGKIENAAFLSDLDYKKIEKSLGEGNSIITVSKIKELV